MTKKIDYYGNEDNYIHLKFGEARKCYNFTNDFRKEYVWFVEQYEKYWEYKPCEFSNVEELIEWIFESEIPVHLYFNYTDTPVKNKQEVLDWFIDNKY